MSFFTGEDKFENTRVYSKWLTHSWVTIVKKKYLNVDKFEYYEHSPWEDEEMLDGTDGLQFSPSLDKADVIGVFMSPLSRNIYFDH